MKSDDIENRHWRLQHNDVQSLGHKVPGFDARHYYDQQEALAAQQAASRWPRLAQWLGYGDGLHAEHSLPLDKADHSV